VTRRERQQLAEHVAGVLLVVLGFVIGSWTVPALLSMGGAA